MTLQKQTKLINNRFEILILFFYYQNVLHRAVADKFCGVDLGDAQNKCWQPCGSNNDCCSTGQSCFETGSACGSGELSGTDRYYCGVTENYKSLRRDEFGRNALGLFSRVPISNNS